MISGRQALGTIEQSIAAERAAVEETEARLEALLEEEESLHKADLEDFRHLAKLRLDHIVEGKVIGHMERMERQAVQILSQRDRERTDTRPRSGSRPASGGA
jgi:hypothetical protein